MLGFLGTGFYSYARGIFLPSLADTLANGERFQIAIGFSGAAVIGTVMSPWLGKVLDNHSPRLVIMIGIGVVSLSYIALGSATTLWHFYLAVSVGMGIGMTCMGTQAWHRCIIFWFDHWRGRAIAIAVMGASCAGMMMPPLVNALVENFGWRNGYLAFAASTAIALLPLVYLLLKDRPEEIDEVRDGNSYVQRHQDDVIDIARDHRVWTWQEMLRTRALWSIGLIFGTMVCVFTTVMLHLYSHLGDIGLDTAQAAWVLSITALFAAGGKPIIGWLSDQFGARVCIWLALACQGFALVLLANATTLVDSVVAAGLYGFGYSGMSPLRTFAVSTSLGSASFSQATGVLRWVELPFLLSASPLAGYIYDVTGSYQTAFYILSGLILVACCGPLAISAGGARERRALRAAN